MSAEKRYIGLLFLAFVCLCLGLVNYALFRKNIIVLNFFRFNPQFAFSLKPRLLHTFMMNYFSDMMWCMALCFVTVAFSELNILNRSGKMIILMVPFITEVAQNFGIIPGTFDWYDLLLYSAIVSLFVLLAPTLKRK